VQSGSIEWGAAEAGRACPSKPRIHQTPHLRRTAPSAAAVMRDRTSAECREISPIAVGSFVSVVRGGRRHRPAARSCRSPGGKDRKSGSVSGMRSPTGGRMARTRIDAGGDPGDRFSVGPPRWDPGSRRTRDHRSRGSAPRGIGQAHGCHRAARPRGYHSTVPGRVEIACSRRSSPTHSRRRAYVVVPITGRSRVGDIGGDRTRRHSRQRNG
jgi:hypothetical protein